MPGPGSISNICKICKNISLLAARPLSSSFFTLSCRFTDPDLLNSYTAKRHFGTTDSRPESSNVQWRQRVVGAQTGHNLKVGPYKRGKWFVSYKDDPGSFITNILIILVTGYAIFTLLPGESMKVRRQRKLRQMLLDKANMTESELNYIENYKLEGEDQKIN